MTTEPTIRKGLVELSLTYASKPPPGSTPPEAAGPNGALILIHDLYLEVSGLEAPPALQGWINTCFCLNVATLSAWKLSIYFLKLFTAER